MHQISIQKRYLVKKSARPIDVQGHRLTAHTDSRRTTCMRDDRRRHSHTAPGPTTSGPPLSTATVASLLRRTPFRVLRMFFVGRCGSNGTRRIHRSSSDSCCSSRLLRLPLTRPFLLSLRFFCSFAGLDSQRTSSHSLFMTPILK